MLANDFSESNFCPNCGSLVYRSGLCRECARFVPEPDRDALCARAINQAIREEEREREWASLEPLSLKATAVIISLIVLGCLLGIGIVLYLAPAIDSWRW